MRDEVMSHYGLTRPLNHAGYYETEHHKQILHNIKSSIQQGRLIAVCGMVGSGKTVTMRRLQTMLHEEGRVLVARALSIEKRNIKIDTLIAALFYDLCKDKQVVVPKGEKRERDLEALIKKCKKTVALFIDEAHDLNGNTLISIKRLIEVVEQSNGCLSVVLSGHPKLKNDLRRPSMEEIGYRTDIFNLDGITGSQREYIYWLLNTCSDANTEPESIFTADAINVLASRLRTPLQVLQHLSLALETGFLVGETPISAELVESILSRDIDGLEATLTRNGYRLKDMTEQFDAKPAEMRALFNQQLESRRATEIQDKIRAAGVPV